MERKNYVLTEKSCEILQAVKAEKNLKSETAALEYVLNEYAERMNLLKSISDIVSENISAQFDRLIGTAVLAEQNSELLLDAMNTILRERGYNICYSADQYPSDVMIQAEEYRRKRVEKLKQKKDNRREL